MQSVQIGATVKLKVLKEQVKVTKTKGIEVNMN